MADAPIRRNAEARFRRGAVTAWRVALFLFALLAGALAWSIVLEPAWRAAHLPGPLGPAAGLLADRMIHAALRHSPAILLAVGAWEAALILRRFAAGYAPLPRNAASISLMGTALFAAGFMAAFGAPTLLAILDSHHWTLRIHLGADALALMVLGMIAQMAGRALHEAG